MGTVHYLATRRNLEHHTQKFDETSFRVAMAGGRFWVYTESTVALVRARSELDSWYGFFGPIKRFLQPVQHMLAVETLARAEYKQREAYRDFQKARSKMYEGMI
jgi:hypothetical protein